MPLACKICLATKGLSGADIISVPKNQKELVDHIESVHHMPVRQDNETEKQAIKRFLKKYPEAKTCQDCREAGAPWAQDTKGAKA